MKIAIIGSENFEHLMSNSKLSKKDINNSLVKVGKLLSKINCEVGVFADEKVPVQLARLYDRNYGDNVTAFTIKGREYEESLNQYDKKIESKTIGEACSKLAGWADKVIVVGLSPKAFAVLGIIGDGSQDYEILVMKPFISKPIHKELKDYAAQIKEMKNVYELEREIKWD